MIKTKICIQKTRGELRSFGQKKSKVFIHIFNKCFFLFNEKATLLYACFYLFILYAVYVYLCVFTSCGNILIICVVRMKRFFAKISDDVGDLLFFLLLLLLLFTMNSIHNDDDQQQKNINKILIEIFGEKKTFQITIKTT